MSEQRTNLEAERAEQRRIEADIHRTRSEIGEDIRAISEKIGEKLSPEYLKQEAEKVAIQAKDAAVGKLREAKERAMESVSEKIEDVEMQARRASDATLNFVRDNAVPLALIGVGLGWLIASNRRTSDEWRPPRRSRFGGTSDEYRRRIRRGMDRAREKVSDAAWRAEERAHGVAERAESKLTEVKERAEQKFSEVAERAEHGFSEGRERVREFGHVAQRRFHDAEERSRDFALENPLAVGLVAAAAGVGVAMLLPATEKENELLGPARDRLISGARQTAEEVGRTVKQTAEEVKSSVSEQLHH